MINQCKKYEGDVLNLGFKDEFIPHGDASKLHEIYGLDVEGITKSIEKFVRR